MNEQGCHVPAEFSSEAGLSHIPEESFLVKEQGFVIYLKSPFW